MFRYNERLIYKARIQKLIASYINNFIEKESETKENDKCKL